jgi:DNA-binding transcriptional LysR family regulator
MKSIGPGDLNDYRYFAVVVDHGGFSAAARMLGLPKSRLSRRVAELEAHLGVRLLQRSTRKLTLTDVGRQVLAHCRALVHEAEAAGREASRRQAEASGLVRVSMPAGMLDVEFAEVFERFLADHPKVTLETVLTPRRVDLIEEGIDLALRARIVDDDDPQWATCRLHSTRSLLVASPECAARYDGLESFESLAKAPALGIPQADHKIHWKLFGPRGEVREVAASTRLACEHFGMRTRAAVAGLGVTMLPDMFVAPEIAAG